MRGRALGTDHGPRRNRVDTELAEVVFRSDRRCRGKRAMIAVTGAVIVTVDALVGDSR